jgi:hypothetical protein
MAATTARVTITRTKTYTFTADFPNYSGLTDAQILAAAKLPGNPASMGELLATSPGANGSVAVSSDWSVAARSNIEPYTVWTPNTAVTLTAGVRHSPTASSNRIYVPTVAGTTGATEPSWPTAIGSEVVSGTVTYIATDKFTTFPAFQASTAYGKGQIVTSAGAQYLATVAGTSGGSAPSTTVGSTVVNGTVTFLRLV